MINGLGCLAQGEFLQHGQLTPLGSARAPLLCWALKNRRVLWALLQAKVKVEEKWKDQVVCPSGRQRESFPEPWHKVIVYCLSADEPAPHRLSVCLPACMSLLFVFICALQYKQPLTNIQPPKICLHALGVTP